MFFFNMSSKNGLRKLRSCIEHGLMKNLVLITIECMKYMNNSLFQCRTLFIVKLIYFCNIL